MTRNSRTLATLIATAVAAIALPAAAGSWPNLPAKNASPDGFVFGAEEGGYSLSQYSYFRQEDDEVAGRRAAAIAPRTSGAAAVQVSDAFEMVGGDTGWQLKQHKYQVVAGRFAHSEECDHAIRTAIGPTPAEVERARNQSPGA